MSMEFAGVVASYIVQLIQILIWNEGNGCFKTTMGPYQWLSLLLMLSTSAYMCFTESLRVALESSTYILIQTVRNALLYDCD